MTYYVMGVGGRVQTYSPHTQKLFFDEKWKKEREEIGGWGDVYIFYIVDTCEVVKLFKSIEVGIIYIGQWGGGGASAGGG